MIRYVPTSGSAIAQQLTEALWQLSTPPSHQGLRRTTALFGCHTMTDGSVWLAVNTDTAVRIHQDATLGCIGDVLQPWVAEGALPSNTLEHLAALIDSRRGNTMVVWDAFPQLFKDQSRTFDELVSAGLIKTTFP